MNQAIQPPAKKTAYGATSKPPRQRPARMVSTLPAHLPSARKASPDKLHRKIGT